MCPDKCEGSEVGRAQETGDLLGSELCTKTKYVFRVFQKRNCIGKRKQKQKQQQPQRNKVHSFPRINFTNAQKGNCVM